MGSCSYQGALAERSLVRSTLVSESKALILTNRSDAQSVSIMALGCLHPAIKVQSAAIHFFLGSDQEVDDSDQESEEEVNVQALHHRREINKKTRSGDKKLQKKLDTAKKVSQSVHFSLLPLILCLETA